MTTKQTTEPGPRPKGPAAPADAERVEEQQSRSWLRRSKQAVTTKTSTLPAGFDVEGHERYIPPSWRDRYARLNTPEAVAKLRREWYDMGQHVPLQIPDPLETIVGDCPLRFSPGEKGAPSWIHNQIMWRVRREVEPEQTAAREQRTDDTLTCFWCGRVAGAGERRIAGLEEFTSTGWGPAKEKCCSSCADLFADRLAERRRAAQANLVAAIDARIDQRLAESNVRTAWENRA